MNSRKISVIGLGYVGLPVAVAFGKSARVVGFDVNAQRIRELQSGEDRTLEVEPNDLRGAEILFTDQLEDLREADFHIVVVPTPINQAKQPELAPEVFKEMQLQGVVPQFITCNALISSCEKGKQP